MTAAPGETSAAARLAARRPVAVTVTALAFALVGWLSWRELPIDLLPDLRSPTIVVAVSSGDRPPTEMERLYGEQVEQRLFTVRGIREVQQVARTGRLIATVRFDWDADMDYALVEVQKAVNPVAADPEVDEVLVRQLDPRQSPVMTLGLAAEAGRSRPRRTPAARPPAGRARHGGQLARRRRSAGAGRARAGGPACGSTAIGMQAFGVTLQPTWSTRLVGRERRHRRRHPGGPADRSSWSAASRASAIRPRRGASRHPLPNAGGRRGPGRPASRSGYRGCRRGRSGRRRDRPPGARGTAARASACRCSRKPARTRSKSRAPCSIGPREPRARPAPGAMSPW